MAANYYNQFGAAAAQNTPTQQSAQTQPQQGKPSENGDIYPFPLMDRVVAGGVNVRYLELNGVKLKHQIITIRVDAAGKRFAFETQSKVTNDRILGIMLTTTETADDVYKNINDSTIQLTIDNEEILPDGFDCSLISQKIGNAFYDNVYPCNERADGSLIKGSFTSGTENFVNPYDVKLYLWCVSKPRK